MDCRGCQVEREECYEWQSAGFDAGLELAEGHWFVFVLDKKGKYIIE